MTTHVFHDQGIIFYVPEDGREETYPCWSTFMRIAVSVAQMKDVRHPDAEHVQFLTFYDDRNELLGIQMPDPVLLNGSPREEVLLGLRAILCEEEVTDLMVRLSEGKRMVEAGLFTDPSSN